MYLVKVQLSMGFSFNEVRYKYSPFFTKIGQVFSCCAFLGHCLNGGGGVQGVSDQGRRWECHCKYIEEN